MVPLAAGVVVLVRFRFSDLSQTKMRPAVVLADAGRGDWILRQVTSKPYADNAAVVLDAGDFRQGSFAGHEPHAAGKLFTASDYLTYRTIGILQPEPLRKVITAVVMILGGHREWD